MKNWSKNQMSNTPFVSICIPTYKASDFFERVITSIIGQDFLDFEIIITDDSPDDCISDVLADKICPVSLTYIKNGKTLGAPGNWNRAISLASGKYIKILHHDDWLLSSQSLSQFVELMESLPEAVLGFSSAKAYNQDHAFRFIHIPSKDRIADLRNDCNTLFFGNLIGPPSSIIYKNTPGLRFDENLRWLVDIDFYIQLLQENKAFAYCPKPLVGVTVESAHQVTRECENNKAVELYEHLYLYSKLSNKTKQFPKYLRSFSQLFQKFSIRSSRELTLLVPNVNIPWYLKALAQVPR